MAASLDSQVMLEEFAATAINDVANEVSLGGKLGMFSLKGGDISRAKAREAGPKTRTLRPKQIHSA
jgi:hypothetical protein